MPKRSFRHRFKNWKQEQRQRERAAASASEPTSDAVEDESDVEVKAVSSSSSFVDLHQQHRTSSKLWAAGDARQRALSSLQQLLGGGYRPDEASALTNVLATAGTEACIHFADLLADLASHHTQTTRQLNAALQDSKNEQRRLWVELEASIAAEQYLRSLVDDMSSKLAQLQRLADSVLKENEELHRRMSGFCMNAIS
jgi:hypothetical protein